MIASIFARNQLMRLSSLPFFDRVDVVVFAEMLETLAAARTEAICKAAVDNLVADLQERPTIRDIQRAVIAENDAQQAPASQTFCEKCVNGKPPGWLHERQTVRGMMYEFSGRCRCQLMAQAPVKPAVPLAPAVQDNYIARLAADGELDFLDWTGSTEKKRRS
jgi:hypothetical protein